MSSSAAGGAWVDGRQSPAALGVQRGVLRHFGTLGQASLCEFALASGGGPIFWRWMAGARW